MVQFSGSTIGVVCLVTNNSFIDQVAFDGMRKHLLQDFTCIYHLHLEGNSRHNPTLSGTAYNVFGIRLGIGITVAIRSSKHKGRRLLFYRIDKTLTRAEKLNWLTERGTLGAVGWELLAPDTRHNWLEVEHAAEFASLPALGSRKVKATENQNGEAVFAAYSLGVSTNRDAVVYDFDRKRLATRVEKFCDDYNAELDRYRRKGGGVNLDDFLDTSKVKWSRNLKRSLRNDETLDFTGGAIRKAVYRPFAKKHLYFADIVVDEMGQFPRIFPTAAAESENVAIALTSLGSEKPFMALAINFICDLHLVGAGCGAQCFPFYVYDVGGLSRQENITNWALRMFRAHYDDKSISKWDVFHYIYGLLHHPGYRERFADNLKRDLPRIPFAPDFRAFARAGQELAELHLSYEELEPYPLEWLETPGVPLSFSVTDAMRLNNEKTGLIVNPSLTLDGIPPEAIQYRLGSRSALEWVIDQYQVSEDKRSRIRSDPNRAEDKEYIVRLVGQVVQVSVKTTAIIDQLPREFM